MDNIDLTIKYIETINFSPSIDNILEDLYSCATLGDYCEASCEAKDLDPWATNCCLGCLKRKVKEVSNAHKEKMRILAQFYEAKNKELRSIISNLHNLVKPDCLSQKDRLRLIVIEGWLKDLEIEAKDLEIEVK